MFLWILQVGIISLILIFLVHHIFNFLKTTLTVPKVKDLVNSNNMKYDSIAKVLENSHDNLLPFKEEKESIPLDQDLMKNELKNFLKKQMNPEVNNEPSYAASTSTSLSSLDW